MAATKEKAKKTTAMKPEVILQFDDHNVDTSAVVADAKAAFKEANGRAAIKSCKIYLKPEECAAYYVINDEFSGKIEL